MNRLDRRDVDHGVLGLHEAELARQGKDDCADPLMHCCVSWKESCDINKVSVQEGGQGVTCSDNQPWLESLGLSFRFSVIAVSGKHGLTGDENCGMFFPLSPYRLSD